MRRRGSASSRTPPAICTEGQTPETDGCVLPAEAATVGDGTAGPCDGNLRLVATIMSPRDPEWSMASIAQGNGGTLLYRAGSTVGGKTVKEVGAQAVLMQQGSSECFIAMFVETPAAQSRASRSGSMAVPGMMADMDDDSSMTRESARERAERRARERNAGLSTEQMNEGITRVSDTNFNVQGDLIRNVMGDQEALMRTARVIPHVEDGTTVGVKLYGIRRSSLLGRLGLQNGDMLRTINGFDMTSPDAALEAYARLQSADHLSVSILRRGQPVTIDYSVQ